MLDLSNLKPAKGSKHKRKVVGRGDSSGHGTTACRGQKGQSSRSGGGKGPWFEGGQTPLYRRLPKKRGFTNIFKKEYRILNIGDLSEFEGSVSPDKLLSAKLIREGERVKILGGGEMKKALTVEADAFSASAKKKIETMGGKVVILKAKERVRQAKSRWNRDGGEVKNA